MFKKNDKSMFLLRKIVNVTLFVLMCVCVVGGIILMASAKTVETGYDYLGAPITQSYFNVIGFIGGFVVFALGPVLLQLVWLVFDMKFNSCLDVKLVRNALFNQGEVFQPAPLFHKFKNEECVLNNGMEVYENIKKYKILFDEEAITADEFEDIKKRLLAKDSAAGSQINSSIEKVKMLKSYADSDIISQEEYAQEKAKLLNK